MCFVQFTSMIRIKATFNDRIIVKHILNCGLYKPKEKCKQLCNYLQNMVRKGNFVVQRGILLHMSTSGVFWPYFVNNCKPVCTFPLVYVNHNSKCVLRLFGRGMSPLFGSLRYVTLYKVAHSDPPCWMKKNNFFLRFVNIFDFCPNMGKTNKKRTVNVGIPQWLK